MQLLFIADPLASFNTKKDTTFAMMREAQRRGYAIYACQPQHLQWQAGGQVEALVQHIRITDAAPGSTDWFEVLQTQTRTVASFTASLMRKDPPFDSEFFYATHLLSQAEREGAKVFNNPAALREHPEKLAVMEFPQFLGPTLVTRQASAIRAFHALHQDIILKPLDGMGGMGIFRVKSDGLNLGSIIETLNQNGGTSVMVQKFLPEISAGDKHPHHWGPARALLLGSHPTRQRSAWQPGCRWQRRGTTPECLQSSHGRGRWCPTGPSGFAAHWVGCYWRVHHRNQCDQPHLLPGNSAANRL